MKISYSGKPLAEAPRGYVRVVFIEEKGIKRLVRDNGIETIEIGVAPGMTRRRFITLCRSVITTAKQFKAKKIALEFPTSKKFWEGFEEKNFENLSQLATENYEMANFDFTKFKTKPNESTFSACPRRKCGRFI